MTINSKGEYIMKKRNINRKITLLVLTVMILGFDVAGMVFADHVTGVPHYHNDSTTRSVAENTPAGKNIGNQVSAHSTGAYYRSAHRGICIVFLVI